MTNKLKFGQIKPNLGIPINWSNPLSKGLVGYWPMLEGTGNVTQDASGNYRNMSLALGAYFESDYIFLDGTDDYLRANAIPFSGGVYDITVMVEFRSSDTANTECVLCISGTSSVYHSCRLIFGGSYPT